MALSHELFIIQCVVIEMLAYMTHELEYSLLRPLHINLREPHITGYLKSGTIRLLASQHFATQLKFYAFHFKNDLKHQALSTFYNVKTHNYQRWKKKLHLDFLL